MWTNQVGHFVFPYCEDSNEAHWWSSYWISTDVENHISIAIFVSFQMSRFFLLQYGF